MSTRNAKAVAMRTKYSKDELIGIGEKMDVKIYHSWSKIKMAKALIDNGYSDADSSEEATESEDDIESNESEMDQNHNHNHNDNSNNELDDTNDNQIVLPQTLSQMINATGHQIHFDVSAQTLIPTIGYQFWRRTLLSDASTLEEDLKTTVNYINKHQNKIKFEQDKITGSTTATAKPGRPPQCKEASKDQQRN